MEGAKIGSAPGEGERRAQRGYVRQYDSAAAAIYAALERDDLIWIGLADRGAGGADDAVLGLRDRIIAHQFKTSKYPKPFRVRTFLLGSSGLLPALVSAWRNLRTEFPRDRIEVRLVTNDFPSANDSLIDGADGHSAAFLREFETSPGKTLVEWRRSRWAELVTELADSSGLEEAEFDAFIGTLHILWGSAADFTQIQLLSPTAARQIAEIAMTLPRLVADPRDKDRWTREEFLKELGWRDAFALRRIHEFPVGVYVQRNIATERVLREAVNSAESGYIALVGPPGVGKSTLLQSALSTYANLAVVRYLAFLPGEGQGIGRGEADDFLDDVNAQLKRSGLAGVRFRDSTLQERREHFEHLMRQAGNRFSEEQIRTLIVVDGLDHVPREERPARSLLAELPLPSSIPAGVLFVLGTQRLDLADLRPAVREQAALSQRTVLVDPLPPEAVYRMADALGLDPEIPRNRLYDLCRGHPLVTRYLIQALRAAKPTRRRVILDGEFVFEGDIETVYASAWREIQDDEEALEVMAYLARAEGSIEPALLGKAVSERAVERAYKSTRYLLKEDSHGWSVFHNSFRLFILSKPTLRFGRPDAEYSLSIYRKLAQLARTADARSPQRWLELRYLARANDSKEVLLLAQPARFRQHLSDARPAADIQADIRLSFGTAKTMGDAATVFRLLLSRDEIERRAGALESAPAVVDAFLTLGDIDGAYAFAQANSTGEYKVVDAFLKSGEIDRARTLFDQIEILSQLYRGARNEYSDLDGQLDEWASRVFHFRDTAQIDEAIDRLSKSERIGRPRQRQDSGNALGKSLRLQIARAVLAWNPLTDPLELKSKLGVDDDYLPILLIDVASALKGRGEMEPALRLLAEAAAHSGFAELPDSWRRRASFIALALGDRPTAKTIFSTLKPPAIASMDDSIDEGAPAQLAHAVMEYADLATQLEEPIGETVPSGRKLLRPLQYHANAVGVLRGRIRSGRFVAQGDVRRAAHETLIYLQQARPSAADEYYAIRQLVLAAPELGRALIQVAVQCGEAEFAAVVSEFDQAFADPDSTLGRQADLRRTIAVEMYRGDGDGAAACRRIEWLVGLKEDTPSAQVQHMAELAVAFARVGNEIRAKDLLHELHSESLGYALPPKKDAQYATWLELLERANESDPGRRAERVSVLMRQVHGMTRTEGMSAAYRLTAALVREASMANPRVGLSAAHSIADWGLLSWDGIVNSLLLGVIRRRSDLVNVSIATWTSLVVPYYSEPHYHEHLLSEFVSESISMVPIGVLSDATDLFRGTIEAEAQPIVRPKLIDSLREAAERRGYTDSRLTAALSRWRSEAPPEKYTNTPGPYDDVSSLRELNNRLTEAKEEPLGGDGTYARLVLSSDLAEARGMFERWPILHRSHRARFALVERALVAGEIGLARDLVDAYRAQLNDEVTWSYWSGAGRLRYFQARLKTHGAEAYEQAYTDLVGELAAGREYAQSLLFDVDDVFQTIVPRPDWVTMWFQLEEQLRTTREYAMGTDFKVMEEPSTEEELIAEVYQWALSLSLFEVTEHVRLGVLRVLGTSQGAPVVDPLIRRLIEGRGDEAAEALQLLVFDNADRAAETLKGPIRRLVDHPDYAVAVAASHLTRRWGGNVESKTPKQLPEFYRIELDDKVEEFEPPSLIDPKSGAMLVEDPLGWTFPFEGIVRSLARRGVSIKHIRHRCWLLIREWGGLPVFGQAATERLESELSRLRMRLTYARPHAAVAARALRYVAAEMRAAGALGQSDEPWLLEMMGYPVVRLAALAPSERPDYIASPALDRIGWSTPEKQQWIDSVDDDVRGLGCGRNTVLAEVTRFRRRDIRERLTAERMRVPFFEVGGGKELSGWFAEIPAAIWAEGFVPLSDEAARTVIRRFRQSEKPEAPRHMMVICPHWLKRLRWRHHSDNWLVYVDGSGNLVANTVWWRDGGPGDVDEDVLWAEGVLVLLTPEGHEQLESVVGALTLQVLSRRAFEPANGEAEPNCRVAAVRELPRPR